MAERPTLVNIELLNFQGLYTKVASSIINPDQLRVCQNADFFREYGAASRTRGTSRVLSNQYTESGAPKSIPWIGFYKSIDLSGALDRQVLVGAGTTIQKINSDGSLTSLLTGEPDNLFRTHGQLDRFMYITSQDPNEVGKRGSKMLKYDGTNVSEWGVTPPGEQETIIEDFNDASQWTLNNCTADDETTISWNGDSIKVVKLTNSGSAFIQRLNISPVFDISNVEEDRAQVRIFIPRDAYRTLATSGRAVSVYIGSDGNLSTDYYRYDFQIGRLVEGWNTLSLDFSTFPSGNFGTTVGSPNDNALNAYRFEIVTNNASDIPTVYWDTFLEFDQGNSDPSFSGGGGSVFPDGGVWSYRFTFVTEDGVESNGGPVVEADNSAGGQGFSSIDHINVPVSTNPAINRRRVYRTISNGTEWFFHSTINDNVTTTFSDTTADVSLGVSLVPLAGDDVNDQSRPPFAGISLVWKRTVFLAGDPLNPQILYFSRFDIPDAFPILNAFELDSVITGIFETHEGLVVTTDTDMWRVIGDNPDYFVERVVKDKGAIGERAVGNARENGFAFDRDGLRLYDLRDTIKISEVIRDQIDAIDKSEIEDTHITHSKAHNSITTFHKDSSGDFRDIFRYQYGIDDVRNGWYSTVSLPAGVEFVSSEEVEDSNGNFKLYVGSGDGMVYELYAESADNWVDVSGSESAITFQIRTAYLRPGPLGQEVTGTTGRVVPRWIELRINEPNNNAVNFSIKVETADGQSDGANVRDDQTITFPFSSGVSLVRLPTQNLTGAEFIRFTISTSDLNVDPRVYGLKVWFYILPGQFLVDGTNLGGRG
jgi:hypothetical protein